MKVRLTQIDGKLPNLALMKLSAWHRARGDDVHFSRRVTPDLFEPAYDRVYASAIFKFSAGKLADFLEQWPGAIIGGTGTDTKITVEQALRLNIEDYEHYDYSIYPGFTASLGFSQRGCRLKCKFCVVPGKEGKPRSTNAIARIWRGEGHPKNIVLLDNDFFGAPEWRERVDELRTGNFRVCLNQGINVRLIDDESAAALASIEYRDSKFQRRRLYTAWDNLKDEAIFFRGVDRLERAGIPADHLMAYMLIGYDPSETFERVRYRFDKMVARGIRPYPMVFDASKTELKRFQRWANMGLYRTIPWEDYLGSKHQDAVDRARDAGWFGEDAA